MGASGILTIPITLLCLFTLEIVAETNIPVTIVNGFNITIRQAPYIASLRYYRYEVRYLGRGTYCTGSIIRNRVVLTSAACVYGQKMNEIVVNVGSTSIQIRSETTKMLRIAFWRWHRLYKPTDVLYNIAVVFTYDDIEPVQGFVSYAPLNYMEVRKGVKCLEFGWDRNANNSFGHLQAIWVSSLSRRECYAKHVGKFGFMCTTSSSRSSGLSESGAPVMCNNKLSGIACVTWANSNITGHTVIHVYAKWIRAAIYLHFKSLKASPRKGQRAAKPLTTSTSIPILSICVQWTVVCAIGIYVAYILAPIFYFYCNF